MLVANNDSSLHTLHIDLKTATTAHLDIMVVSCQAESKS